MIFGRLYPRSTFVPLTCARETFDLPPPHPQPSSLDCASRRVLRVLPELLAQYTATWQSPKNVSYLLGVILKLMQDDALFLLISILLVALIGCSKRL